MKAWGRLFRIALLPSAAADVAAGVVLGGGAWPTGAGPWLLILASLCVYHGAMALNDWADRDLDARERSGRPIPEGQISPASALTAAVGLLALSPALAVLAVRGFGASPAAVGAVGALVVAAQLAVAYDLGPRGPRLGPVLLAGCRALNLGAGVLFGVAATGGAGEPLLGLVAAALYAGYVFVVSQLGRLEDGEDERDVATHAPRLLRRLATLLALVGALALLRAVLVEGRAPSPIELVPLALSAAGAFELFRRARGGLASRGDVLAAMGAALRRLLVFSASAAALVGSATGLLVAGLVLLGFPASFWLRKAFPPS